MAGRGKARAIAALGADVWSRRITRGHRLVYQRALSLLNVGATVRQSMVLQGLMTSGFCLFETAIGTGGIAWGEAGITGVQLPEPDAERVRQRLRRRFSNANESVPPVAIQDVIEHIRALMRGGQPDLSAVTLDMRRVPEFARRVYEAARTIPAGETLTYGEIAKRLGEEPRMAKDVGQALARNPYPIIVPCHRVVAAGGKLGGFSAAGGVATKQRLLDIERANASWQLPLLATS
jgi:methylated-DNA-[protein]-cysteine S-methyltransferase